MEKTMMKFLTNPISLCKSETKGKRREKTQTPFNPYIEISNKRMCQYNECANIPKHKNHPILLAISVISGNNKVTFRFT